jgi:hypothetical protein
MTDGIGCACVLEARFFVALPASLSVMFINCCATYFFFKEGLDHEKTNEKQGEHEEVICSCPRHEVIKRD